MTEPARDAFATAVLARQGWTTWLPGDGSSYQVHLLPISIGPDRADLVLLLNIERRTVAFQFPAADYRKRETGPWTWKRAHEQGIRRDLWDAAKPLLIVLGATRKPAKPTPPPAVVDVQLPAETNEVEPRRWPIGSPEPAEKGLKLRSELTGVVFRFSPWNDWEAMPPEGNGQRYSWLALNGMSSVNAAELVEVLNPDGAR